MVNEVTETADPLDAGMVGVEVAGGVVVEESGKTARGDRHSQRGMATEHLG